MSVHENTSNTTPANGLIPWSFIVIAFVLAAAAITKSAELAQSPSVSNYVFGSLPFTIVLIEIELALAIWLISGFKTQLAILAAIGVFSIFAVYALTLVLNGSSNCGCFGLLQVHPAITLTLDVGIVSMLLVQIRKTVGIRKSRSVFPIGGALMVAALVLATSNRTVLFESDIQAVEDSLIVLEPQKWLGNELPIKKYLVGSDEIGEGEWNVVFYKNDCQICRRHIQRIMLDANHLPTALINVSGSVESSSSIAKEDSAKLKWLRMDQKYKWFAEVPVAVSLEGGIVTNCQTREELESH